MLVADATDGAEVISVAGDRAQARIVFDSAKRMVEFSPRLSATLGIFRDAIEDPGTDSVCRVMSADAPQKHGLRPSAVIFDEFHVQPSRELWDVLESGFGARTEPLLLGISTAGYDRASLLGDLVRERRRARTRGSCIGGSGRPRTRRPTTATRRRGGPRTRRFRAAIRSSSRPASSTWLVVSQRTSSAGCT
jgi:hypothetical protein